MPAKRKRLKTKSQCQQANRSSYKCDLNAVYILCDRVLRIAHTGVIAQVFDGSYEILRREDYSVNGYPYALRNFLTRFMGHYNNGMVRVPAAARIGIK